MAIAIRTILEVENGGSDNNGGGFNPTNANFPTDGAVSSANTASPVFSSASYNFVAGDVGALLYIKSGTNSTPGFYTIASVASNQATLDAAVGHAALINTNNQTTYTTNSAAGCGTAASLTTLTWGIAYIKQSAAQVAYTDLVIGNPTTTQLTSALKPFGVNHVGNLVNITGGTGFTTGRYEVVSVSGSTATMDRSVGTAASSAGTGNLGGALATVGTAITTINNGTTTATETGTSGGLTINIKYNAVVFTTASQINIKGGQGGTKTIIQGYNAFWHDLDNLDTGANYPTIQLTAAVTSIFGLQSSTPQGDETIIRNLILDCNSNGGGIFIGIGYADIINVIIKNWPSGGYGYRITDLSKVQRAFLTGGKNGATGGAWHNAANSIFMVASVGNVGQPGFYNQGGSGSPHMLRCLSLNNTTVVSNQGDGFYSAANPGWVLDQCVGAGNARDGAHYDGSAFLSGPNGAMSQSATRNCIFSKNSGSALNSNGSVFWNAANVDYNARFSNTNPDVNVPAGVHDVTLSGDPFVNSAATLNSLADVITNFALNATAGAGAACKAVGYPANLDLGALQSAASASGGPVGNNFRGGFSNG